MHMISIPFSILYSGTLPWCILQVLGPFDLVLILIFGTFLNHHNGNPHFICSWSKERKTISWPEMTMICARLVTLSIFVFPRLCG